MASLDRTTLQALKKLSESIAGQESDSVSTAASSASIEDSTAKKFVKFSATAETDSVVQSLEEMVAYFMQENKKHEIQPCWTMVRQGRHMRDSQSSSAKKAKPKEGFSYSVDEKWSTWGQLPWWVWRSTMLATCKELDAVLGELKKEGFHIKLQEYLVVHPKVPLPKDKLDVDSDCFEACLKEWCGLPEKTGADWEQASARGLEVAKRAIDMKARDGNLKSFAFSNGHPGESNYAGCYEFICEDESLVTGLKHRSTGAEARPFIVNNN